LQGVDANAHRSLRFGALGVLLAAGGGLALVVYMMSDLERLAPSMDTAVNAMRLFASVILPLGTAAIAWGSWQVWRSAARGWLAKLWSLVLLAAALFLLWLGFAYHLIGFGAGY
jgi:magnesium-transporting ATPase (P-type)